MRVLFCFGCYNVVSKEHSGRNCPKRRKTSICKEQYPTGLHDLQPKKRSPEKEEDSYTPPMPPEKESKKDCVRTCASTVAHTDVISMYVVPVSTSR